MKKYICALIFVFFINSAFAHAFFDWSDEEAGGVRMDADDGGLELSDADSMDQGIQDIAMGIVDLEAEFLDGDILKVSVQARDLAAPVLGIAFYLAYDSEKLEFLRYDPGNFLERGGDPFYLVQAGELNSNIVFGATLRRDDKFPLGDGLITHFYFQILEEGMFDFSFKNAVVSTLDTVRQDIDHVIWNDLSIDRGNAGHDAMVAASGYTNVSGFYGKSNLGRGVFPYFKVIMSVGGVIVCSIFLIIYLKKRGVLTSVNFK